MTSSLTGYLELTPEKRRRIFLSLFDYLKIDFRGLHVLDLGPGSGESLDIAKERGAASTTFIDRDELIYNHCIEKGHTGHLMDYGSKELLTLPNNYDLVICRGALNADQWNRGGFEITIQQLMEWIGNTPAIITPTFDAGEVAPEITHTEVLSLNTHKHTCFGDRKNDYLNSEFHLAMTGKLTDFIEGYSHPYCFPFTYSTYFTGN